MENKKYNKLLQAALDHYQALRSESLAHLDLLFNKSVGIGEHTDMLAEIKKWTEVLSQASENLEVLENNFNEYGEVK